MDCNMRTKQALHASSYIFILLLFYSVFNLIHKGVEKYVPVPVINKKEKGRKRGLRMRRLVPLLCLFRAVGSSSMSRAYHSHAVSLINEIHNNEVVNYLLYIDSHLSSRLFTYLFTYSLICSH